MMQRTFGSLLMALSLLLLVAGTVRAQSDADREAIKQTALDYIEGYYEGNAERMERSLHPDLAKRIVRANPSTSKSRLEHMTAPTLVQIAGNMKSRAVPKDKQQKDVTILDLFENAASVKIVANDWIDYLHVSKFDGRWVIVNVLWEMKHRKK
ncbi:MAG TPA: nuclear transport factor 2 family protein [Blastocatellia bacterium]|nr:nuclear transport factor 2 family protein [Blastocatellia bacterium]HMV82587.1 nuclear transport factor 2 family protein [Blastocatellia bacterium]HMZ18045.1 nuclear transport factor 2 family protein [Blastocatellia bacterium]HNG34577.1 nuclear transport factor 2 family protein [Blastocatellia bacterium]